jgi:hypothetical protein
MKRIELTDAMLRRAWDGMRAEHRHWPQDYDQVMGDPVYRRLVRLEALRRALAARAAAAPARPSPARPLPPLPLFSPAVDRKRAASGERDDD